MVAARQDVLKRRRHDGRRLAGWGDDRPSGKIVVEYLARCIMAKKTRSAKALKFERPKRIQLSAEESLKRMQAFSKRKERFIAARKTA